MSCSFVKWPFMDNANRKIEAQEDRWVDSYPIWVPCCIMLPFGWLFRGRRWPDCKKSAHRRRWEREQREGPTSREQTKWPETRLSPCSLRPRREDNKNISDLNLALSAGLGNSILNRLPLEIRQEIYSYVLGKEENCLIIVPFKLRTVPPEQYISNVMNAAVNGRLILEDGNGLWPQRPALLRTCRQVYTEAVRLLYTGNTFVIKHPELLLRFAKAIPPQRFDSIRSLHVCLNPRQSGNFSSWVDSQEWKVFWHNIAGIKNLQNLEVNISDEIHSTNPTKAETVCRTLLLPLLQIRGLLTCRLNVRVLYMVGGFHHYAEDLPISPKTKAFLRKIESVCKLTKETVALKDDEICDCSDSELCPSTGKHRRGPKQITAELSMSERLAH